MNKISSISQNESGFSLVEVVMALGICSFCLIALIGLLTSGLTSNRDTVSQTEAAGLAEMIQADLVTRRVDASGAYIAEPTLRYGINVPTGTSASGLAKTLFLKSDGSIAESSSKADYRVDLSFGARASDVSAIPVYILITWPGAANQNTGDWPSKSVGSFEISTAIIP